MTYPLKAPDAAASTKPVQAAAAYPQVTPHGQDG
jgi:hypothetical protein